MVIRIKNDYLINLLKENNGKLHLFTDNSL